MPCNDGGPPDYYGDYSRQLKRADKLAKMLCDLCYILERRSGGIGYYYDRVDGFKDWHTKHKEQDATRLKQEAESAAKDKLKAKALAKLTAEERKALGL